ncbi:MAG: signal recognition particle-docking protein FtsY [Fidelibacterota bacterium]
MAFIRSLFQALEKTRTSISEVFLQLKGKRVPEEVLDDLEFKLISADMGMTTVNEIMDLVNRYRGMDVRAEVSDMLVRKLPADLPDLAAKPSVIVLIVGVNGTGKTTTTAKLASFFKRQGKSVLLVGTDTYRAGAVEQLRVWSERIGIRLVCNEKSREPSAVLFDGLVAARSSRADVVIVDTAGRLHTYKNLMDELGKMYRIIQQKFSDFTLKTLITIDANLGQNSLIQARQFSTYGQIDGAILTKMDGTAKGGIVFPLYDELKIPVLFIGTGEQLTDINAFDRRDYVHSLIGEE